MAGVSGGGREAGERQLVDRGDRADWCLVALAHHRRHRLIAVLHEQLVDGGDTIVVQRGEKHRDVAPARRELSRDAREFGQFRETLRVEGVEADDLRLRERGEHERRSVRERLDGGEVRREPPSRFEERNEATATGREESGPVGVADEDTAVVHDRSVAQRDAVEPVGAWTLHRAHAPLPVDQRQGRDVRTRPHGGDAVGIVEEGPRHVERRGAHGLSVDGERAQHAVAGSSGEHQRGVGEGREEHDVLAVDRVIGHVGDRSCVGNGVARRDDHHRLPGTLLVQEEGGRAHGIDHVPRARDTGPVAGCCHERAEAQVAVA